MFLCVSMIYIFPDNFQSVVFSITSILSLWDFNWMYLDIYCPPYHLIVDIFYLLVSLCYYKLGNDSTYGFHFTNSLFSCIWYASKPSVEFFISIELIFLSCIWFFLETNLFTFKNLLFLLNKKFLKSYF